MCARERRREARAKFCGVSFRRFLENAGRHAISGVFDENAGRYTPESAVFFVVYGVLFVKYSYPLFNIKGFLPKGA